MNKDKCPKCGGTGQLLQDEVDIGVGMQRVTTGFECDTCGQISYCSSCGAWDFQPHAKWCAAKVDDVDEKLVREMVLFAWVGEDEMGSGEFGLKQGLTQLGLIPLVACKEGKIDQLTLIEQLKNQAKLFKKTIRLAKFKFDSIEITITPDGAAQRTDS